MMSKLSQKAAVVVCIFSGIAATAWAELVNVTTTGVVEFNVIGGNQAGIPPGSPVVMSFHVDSTNFVNSPNFPTRGYPIILDSFSMTVGGSPINIIDPQPSGSTAYFVMRNNDPAVDGFFISSNIDFPIPIGVTIPGLAPNHELNFLRTFNDGNAFPSLDILDALGTYDQTNLSVYSWWVGRFGNAGAEYVYQTITLSIVPEPAGFAVWGTMTLLLISLRRRQQD